VAGQHGLKVDKSEKYGWAITALTEEAAEWIKSTCKDDKGFELFRIKKGWLKHGKCKGIQSVQS
jgi:hypothetical protein